MLQRIIRALFLIACIPCVHAEIFETIDVLKSYAQRMPESVPLENLDYLNPEYVHFLESQLPSGWDRVLMAVKLKSRSEWQPGPFLELLQRVTQKRKKDGMHGKFLQRQEVSQDDHFLVWGNLQGAYHSLVYTLEHLIEQKILDKNLKVIKDKYFMVFAGNVIDRSPYSIETLTLVLRLLDANPTRVFYVKGNHETDDLWQDYDFRDALEYKVAIAKGKLPPYKEGKVPFTDEVNALFDTLPLALYLGMKTVDSADSIRIGFMTRSEFELGVDELSYLLNGADDHTIFPLPIAVPKEQGEKKPGEVVAMIEGNSDLIPNYTSQGLRLLPPDQGTTAWSILSAQTDCYNKLYKFLTDSYADVTIALPMKKATITHHYQEAAHRSGFKTDRVYNIFCGQSDEQFRAQSKITMVNVGSTLDLEGESAILGRQIREGMSLAINKQNQQGIVPGHIVALLMFDDGHVRSKARSNIELISRNYDTHIIMGVEEDMLYKSYLDVVAQDDLLVLFPFTSTLKLHTPNHTNIINYGCSYKEEANVSTEYILDTVAPSKVAIIYRKGRLGEDGLIGARESFKKRGFTTFTEIPITSDLLDFKEQAKQLYRENPDVIGIFSTAGIAQELIRQIGMQYLSQKTLYGLSSFGAQSFRQFYKNKGLNIIVTHLVPDPAKSQLPIVQEFRKDALNNNIIFSPQAFEAYINASVLVEVLRIIKGPITKDAIKKTIESMNNYSFKGLTFTFNKEVRELSDSVWLDSGNDTEWKRFIIGRSTSAVNTISAAIDTIAVPQAGAPLKREAAAPAPKVMEPVQKIVPHTPKVEAPVLAVEKPITQGPEQQ